MEDGEFYSTFVMCFLFSSLSIFDLWFVESTDAKPVDMEGQMYKTQKLG